MLPDAPLVVLTDGESASASEIVAGALQDHDRAVIVGTTSFGKGLVQDIFQLEGGWALKLTTGRWYTPSGRTIQRERRINAQGRLEEVPQDSMAERPVFRSDAGRPVYGGGGITPDVAVNPDSLVGAERELMRLLATRGAVVNEVLQEMAVDLGLEARPDFRSAPERREDLLRRLEDRILWLACWTIHNANHLRPKRDGLKVGGHQASSASLCTILTALYLAVRRVARYRVAVLGLVAALKKRRPFTVSSRTTHRSAPSFGSRSKPKNVCSGEMRPWSQESGQTRRPPFPSPSSRSPGMIMWFRNVPSNVAPMPSRASRKLRSPA